MAEHQTYVTDEGAPSRGHDREGRTYDVKHWDLREPDGKKQVKVESHWAHKPEFNSETGFFTLWRWVPAGERQPTVSVRVENLISYATREDRVAPERCAAHGYPGRSNTTKHDPFADLFAKREPEKPTPQDVPF